MSRCGDLAELKSEEKEENSTKIFVSRPTPSNSTTESQKMADVDDELLALAGGDSSDEGTQSPDEHQVVDKPKSRPKPKAAAASSKKRSSSTSKTKGSASKKQKRDEIDSDEDEEVRDHRRRQHSQDDEEEEEDDDDDDDDDDDLETLYPVEGIYKSAQEREE